MLRLKPSMRLSPKVRVLLTLHQAVNPASYGTVTIQTAQLGRLNSESPGHLPDTCRRRWLECTTCEDTPGILFQQKNYLVRFGWPAEEDDLKSLTVEILVASLNWPTRIAPTSQTMLASMLC